jgi:cation:H+ antiporter
LADPLKRLRRPWGLSEAASAAIIGLAAASPEIGINITSAVRGVVDIGLGAMLGSNIVAIPLVMTVAYWASRKAKLGQAEGQQQGQEQGQHGDHERHRREHLLHVQRPVVTVQALPYLVIVGVLALLALPPGWRGIQPIDGWIMLGVYLVYLVQAVLRGRQEGEQVEWSRKKFGLAAAGLVALAVGAFFTVIATKNIVSTLGMSRIVGGLFFTAPMAALPELFAVWSVTRSGQVTSATISAFGDHAVTLTVALLPLVLVGVPVENLPLLILNLCFGALMPATFTVLARWADTHTASSAGRWGCSMPSTWSTC